MKRGYIFLLSFTFLIMLSCMPASAYTLEDWNENGDSLWIQLDNSNVPSEINALTLFWPLIAYAGAPIPDTVIYNIYAPSDWSGTTYTDSSNVDLSPFEGDDIYFEIITIGEDLDFGNYAYIFSDSEENGVIGGWDDGFQSAQFYFGFYEYADSTGTREVIEYLPGIASLIEPEHGGLFYSFELSGEEIEAELNAILEEWGYPPVDGYFPFSTSLRSDVLEPVPEPMTLLLLGSGLAGFAGLRKRFHRSII